MPVNSEPLRLVFSSLADLPDSEWAYASRFVREAHFAPRDHLLREGDVGNTIHFIVRGLVRNYQNDDGRELVHGFDFEGRFVASYESLITNTPTYLSVQALEETHTLTLPGAVLLNLYDRHPAWDRVGRKILEDATVRRYDKEMRFRRYSPEEHYHLLIERRSPLIARVPLRHLASYLGVAPETLSRIRSRQRDEAKGAGAAP